MEQKNIYLYDVEEVWKPFDLNHEATKDAILAAGIHIEPGAIICKGAKIGPRTVIGVDSVIEESAVIWGDVRIGDGVKIGEGSIISTNTTIHDHALIGSCAIIGSGTIIECGAIIGDDAEIGKQSIIGYGARINNGEKPTCVVISGSRHVIAWWGSNVISIGCKQYTINQW